MSGKQVVILALACTALVSGVVAQYGYPGNPMPPTSFGFAVCASLLIFVWYHIDSEQKGYRRSVFLNVGVVAIALFAMPYYLFRSRGFKRGAIATGLFLLGGISWSVLVIVGQYATYWLIS